MPMRATRIALVLATMLLAVRSPALLAHAVHPLGFTPLAWQAPHIARVTASLMDFHSGAMVLSWSGLGRVERIGGRECLVGPYFLFDVDDSWAHNIDETVDLEIDLERGDGAIVSWDHASSAPEAQILRSSGSGGPMKLRLDRARFANRLFAGSDFAIAATGAVYPYDPDAEHEITVCGVRLGRQAASSPEITPKGRVAIEVVDAATGQPAAVRMGLFDTRGRLPLPSADAVSVRRYDEHLRQVPIVTGREFWPAPGGYAFYVDGRYGAELPAGEYRMVAMKGPEYRLVERVLKVRPGETTRERVELSRWVDAPGAGWYSGDVHVHITRKEQDNPVVLAQMRAEDLHVTNVLQMANVRRYHFPQYAFGERGRFLRGSHALVSGQESPRSGHRGHSIGLNGSRYHAPEQFFLYHRVAASLRADGGLFGYAHLLGDAFHAKRGLALDAPLGLVDFVEVLQFGVVATDLYYDMLNLGLRIAPAGGSDYPYIDLPGSARNYVRIDGAFATDAWFEGLRRGRTFVSNGPLLELDVNGAGMGDTVRIAPGGELMISSRARMNPGLDRLDRLELVAHGEVVASVNSTPGTEELTLSHRLNPGEGLWLAIRAKGKGIGVAHSAPVYVEVGGKPDTFSREAVPALVDGYIGVIDEAMRAEPQEFEDLEHWDTGSDIARQWAAQLPALREHAEQAKARLLEIRAAAVAVPGSP